MSNRSASPTQVLSLPGGGGAIDGIGETFSPDLFTGTGNLSVPIAVPPGRGGLRPDLSLVYSTGSGNGDRPRTMDESPGGLRLADPGVQLLDADGDGRTDLLVTRDGMAGYYPLEHPGGWDRRSFQRLEQASGVDLDAPTVALVDLDDDGVTDALRSGTRLERFFSDPERGWGRTLWSCLREWSADHPQIRVSPPESLSRACVTRNIVRRRTRVCWT